LSIGELRALEILILRKTVFFGRLPADALGQLTNLSVSDWAFFFGGGTMLLIELGTQDGLYLNGLLVQLGLSKEYIHQ